MDLVELLRKKIDLLHEGAYILGLKAVLVHIETAFSHLVRGQETGPETAFTDAIYRTNQAFEGSLKEAYRVLGRKDPSKKTPFEIEKYLDLHKFFRSRVLDQMTRYRTEWRNPSTHDYILDFDEREAFLAVVSVTAFACLLVDQISEQLAFDAGRVDAKRRGSDAMPTVGAGPGQSLHSTVVKLLTLFCENHIHENTDSRRPTELELLGALQGFLFETAPALSVLADEVLLSARAMRPDLVIRNGEESVLVEVKRPGIAAHDAAVHQVRTYLAASGIRYGVLMYLPDRPSPMNRETDPSSTRDRAVIILSPAESNNSLKPTLSLRPRST